MNYLQMGFFSLWGNRPLNKFRLNLCHGRHSFHIYNLKMLSCGKMFVLLVIFFLFRREFTYSNFHILTLNLDHSHLLNVDISSLSFSSVNCLTSLQTFSLSSTLLLNFHIRLQDSPLNYERN